MAFLRLSSAALLAAGIAAVAAVEPSACGRDEESMLQSVSLLQKDTVIVKSAHGGSTLAMAEVTPSGEAVSSFEEDQPLAYDGDAVLSRAEPLHAVAEEHHLEESAARAVAAAAASERVNPMALEDVVALAPLDADLAPLEAQVRKTPIADTLASGPKKRRPLPGVSLLGRMAATVARHGIHAAHAAGSIPHAPHPHEEDAETLMVAVGLFLLAIFSMGCLVLEHRAKERAEAHAMKCLAKASDRTAVNGRAAPPADSNCPGHGMQEREVVDPVGAPVTVGPVRVA